jgi:hypothetical protein
VLELHRPSPIRDTGDAIRVRLATAICSVRLATPSIWKITVRAARYVRVIFHLNGLTPLRLERLRRSALAVPVLAEFVDCDVQRLRGVVEVELWPLSEPGRVQGGGA